MTIKEIFDYLSEGIDPTTGEVFDLSLLGQDETYASFSVLKEIAREERRKTTKKGNYKKLCEEYPGHIVIIKTGYFYTAFFESAEVLGAVMDYKVSYIHGKTAVTGGPDLSIIADKLHAAGLSYIAFNHGEVEDRFDGKNPFLTWEPDEKSQSFSRRPTVEELREIYSEKREVELEKMYLDKLKSGEIPSFEKMDESKNGGNLLL